MTKEAIEQEIQNISKKIAKEFDPEKIILFGSRAWGNPGLDSDTDLLIVKETENTRETAKEIDGALWGRKIPLDIIVYTPGSITKRLAAKDFFVEDVIKKGKILYERPEK